MRHSCGTRYTCYVRAIWQAELDENKRLLRMNKKCVEHNKRGVLCALLFCQSLG